MEISELSKSSVVISRVATALIRQQMAQNSLKGASTMLTRSNIRSFSTHRPLSQPRFKPAHPISRTNIMVSPIANNLQVSAMPKRDFHFPLPIFLLATRLADTEKGKKVILASSVFWMFPGMCSTFIAGGLIYYGFKHMDRHMYYDRNFKQLNDPEMKRKCKEFFKRAQFMKDGDMEEARRFIQSTMRKGGEKIIEISENMKPEHFEKFKAPKRDYQHQINELKSQVIRSIDAVFNSPQLYQSLHLTPEQKLQFGGLFENPHEVEFGSVEFVKQDSGLFSGDAITIQFNIVSHNSFIRVEARGANRDGHMALIDLTLRSIDGQSKLNLPVHMNYY